MNVASGTVRFEAALGMLLAVATAGGGCTQVEDRAPVQVAEEAWPGPSAPLQGAEICEVGTSNCRRTDADGWATLDVPVHEEISLTATKDGYQSELYPLVVPVDGATLHNTLSAEQRLQGEFANVDSPYPMVDTGMLSIITTPRCVGATIEVFGAAGKGKVVYLDDDPDVTWNPDLKATSTTGIAVALELGPGEYRVEIGGAANRCTPLFAWPSRYESSVRTPVRAGFLSESWVSCDCQ